MMLQEVTLLFFLQHHTLDSKCNDVAFIPPFLIKLLHSFQGLNELHHFLPLAVQDQLSVEKQKNSFRLFPGVSGAETINWLLVCTLT